MALNKKIEKSILDSVIGGQFANSVERDQYISGTFAFYDKIFVFMDPLTKYIHLPSFFHFIVVLYLVFQILFSSYWHIKLCPVDDSTLDGRILQYAFLVVFQCDDSSLDQSDQFPLFLLLLFIFVGIFLLFFIISLLLYRSKRYFPKPLLYVYKFLIEFITPAEIIPLVYHFSHFFRKTISQTHTFSAFLFVLNLIILLFLFFIFFLHSSLSSFSVYISRCPFIGLSSNPIIFGFGLVSLSIFLQLFSSLYDIWTSIVVCVFTSLSYGYYAYLIVESSFIQSWALVTFFSAYSVASIMSIFQLFHSFFPFPDFISIIFLFCLFIITFIIIHFILPKIRNHQKNLLSYSSINQQNANDLHSSVIEDEKTSYLESIGAGNNEPFYLQITSYWFI